MSSYKVSLISSMEHRGGLGFEPASRVSVFWYVDAQTLRYLLDYQEQPKIQCLVQ